MKPKRFYAHVEAALAHHDYEIEARNVTYLVDKCVSGHRKYRGRFDTVAKRIVIAKKNRNWMNFLLHEYCHFEQWLHRTAAVHLIEKSYSVVFNDRSARNFRGYFLKCIAYELEAIRMSAKYIRKFDLPIDLKSHIRNTNYYLYSWGFYFYYNRWFPIYKYRTPRTMPTKYLSAEAYLEKECVDRIFVANQHKVKKKRKA